MTELVPAAELSADSTKEPSVRMAGWLLGKLRAPFEPVFPNIQEFVGPPESLAIRSIRKVLGIKTPPSRLS